MSIADSPRKSIELDHVGPIEHLTIPIPEGGGVVVLHGASGVGKTHAIQAVRALHDSAARKSLRASDGVPSGKIEGMGVSVRLGRSNTARGELVCESLDSGVDPSLLVDPGLKDPVAADSKRLATLVRLAGVKITADQWAKMAGDAGEEIAITSLVEDDPVVTADRIRRRLHDAALTKERLAQSKLAEATAIEKSVADVDLQHESDDAYLAGALDGANHRVTEARLKRDAFNDAQLKHAEAVKALTEAKLKLLDPQEQKARLDAAATARSECDRQISLIEQEAGRLSRELSVLNQQLGTAKEKAAEAFKRVGECQSLLDTANRQAETVKTLEAAVNAQLPERISDDEIAALEKARDEALKACSTGTVVRRARGQLAKAESLKFEATETDRQANRLRDLARSTDQALEQALIDAGFTTIKVYDGRLCVESDRGLEPVSELSTGERWELALDLAARGLAPGALLSVQQEGWQALDQDLRRKVATMARERGLVLITAEVDCGDIRAEVLQ